MAAKQDEVTAKLQSDEGSPRDASSRSARREPFFGGALPGELRPPLLDYNSSLGEKRSEHRTFHL